jgi:hypothetical protein
VAQRDEAARQLSGTVVKSSFAGIVTNVPSIAPGKYLQASMTAFYFIATDHVWLYANPKETELTYARRGQSASVTVGILQTLTDDADLLAAQQRALDTASESVRRQRINYRGGGARIFGLLDTQRQYQRALLGYVGAEAQRYEDTIQLLVAMGGGWWGASLTAADSSGPTRRSDFD